MVYPWSIPIVVHGFLTTDLQDKPRPPMVLPVKRLDFVLHRAPPWDEGRGEMGSQKWMTSL